jgi:hypothetical protein
MTKFIHFIASLTIASFLVGSLSFYSSAEGKASANINSSQEELVGSLAIKQGEGNFIQKKYFKFLSQPIQSQGSFLVSEESALWQTETPVFSQLLVKPNAIYQRLSIEDTYQPLIENAEFSAVLTTIFKGQIKYLDWKLLSTENTVSDSVKDIKQQNCLALEPKSQQLTQIFSRVNLCLINPGERKIELLDKQGNKTEILMLLTSDILTEQNLNNLKPL